MILLMYLLVHKFMYQQALVFVCLVNKHLNNFRPRYTTLLVLELLTRSAQISRLSSLRSYWSWNCR